LLPAITKFKYSILKICLLKFKKKKAHQVDNLDRYALTTLTVSRSWSFSPQLQYLQRRYSVQVLENVPVDTIILAMAINKPIDQVSLFFFFFW
jgi:hypothetical protein